MSNRIPCRDGNGAPVGFLDADDNDSRAKPPRPFETRFKARYAYVRVTFKGVTVRAMAGSGRPYDEPVEVVVGVELSSKSTVDDLYSDVRITLHSDIQRWIESGLNDAQLARNVEEEIDRYYPGRSYFIEVGRGEMDDYVQIFEPKDFAR